MISHTIKNAVKRSEVGLSSVLHLGFLIYATSDHKRMRGKGKCIQSNDDFDSVLELKLSASRTKYDNCLHKPFSSDISTPA